MCNVQRGHRNNQFGFAQIERVESQVRSMLSVLSSTVVLVPAPPSLTLLIPCVTGRRTLYCLLCCGSTPAVRV
jgi:hypothetical protein